MRKLPLRKLWIVLVAVSVLMVVASLGVYLLRPLTVTIAVSPSGGDETKLMVAYGEALRQQRLGLRVRILQLDTLRQSAEALQGGSADFAIVRPDVLLPIDGLTVTVLREDAAIVLAPASANLSEVGDLLQHKLGVIIQHEADVPAIAAILSHYELAPPKVTLVPLLPGEAGAALLGKRVDAVALFAAPGAAVVSTLVKTLNRSAERKLTVLAIAEAAAIAEELPKFSEVEIPARGLAGSRKLPPEAQKTVGVSYRLMARSELDRATVAHVVQTLFELRARLARTTPLANRMKALDPDNAAGAALPYHPGAIDYFAREQKTFLERYADWIYILMFGGGGVLSALAWLGQRMAKLHRALVDDVLERLLTLGSACRAAQSNQELDVIAAEVDTLVASTVRQARKRSSGTRTMGALMLAIESARAAILDRRIGVNAAAPAPP